MDAGEKYSVNTLGWQGDAGVETTSRVEHMSVGNLREGVGAAQKCPRRPFVVCSKKVTMIARVMDKVWEGH